MNPLIELYWDKVVDNFHKLKSDERGLGQAVNIVLGLVMIVVIGAIGIFIADKTVSATGTPANPQLANMSSDILSAGTTGSSFVVILVIASIGGLAVTYMFGLLYRGRGGGGI